MPRAEVAEVVARARKGSGRKRQHLVQIWMNDAELALLVALAEANEWSRGATVRYALETLDAALDEPSDTTKAYATWFDKVVADIKAGK